MSLGNWSFAFEDFDREDLLHQLDNPEWQALQKIIDPFNYRLKLENTPKYSITCSGDPFFLERLFLHVDNSDVVTINSHGTSWQTTSGSGLPKSSKMLITAEMSTIAQK